MAVTIPTAWTTASSCMTSGDVWHWDDGSTDVDVLGPPAQTSSCYPPEYTPTLGFAYAANSCPHGFSAACTTDYYSASRTTICCPSGSYAFSCAFVSFSSWTWGCSSSYTSSTAIAVTGVSLGVDTTTTGSPYIGNRRPGDQLLAYGVGISPATQSSASSTSSASTAGFTGTTTSSGTSSTSLAGSAGTSTALAASDSGGLSAGASAGVGIGVGLGIILIAVGGWFLYRRGVNRRRNAGTDAAPVSQVPTELRPELDAPGHGRAYAPKYPSELEGTLQKTHELDASQEAAELP